jgi:hypothetical protein
MSGVCTAPASRNLLKSPHNSGAYLGVLPRKPCPRKPQGARRSARFGPWHDSTILPSPGSTVLVPTYLVPRPCRPRAQSRPLPTRRRRRNGCRAIAGTRTSGRAPAASLEAGSRRIATGRAIVASISVREAGELAVPGRHAPRRPVGFRQLGGEGDPLEHLDDGEQVLARVGVDLHRGELPATGRIDQVRSLTIPGGRARRAPLRGSRRRDRCRSAR